MRIERIRSRCSLTSKGKTVWVVLAVLAGVGFAGHAAEPTRAAAAPRWAVDPRAVGANLPPAGRSLFDYVVSEERNGQRVYNVPFPYTAFTQSIERRLQGANPAPPQLKQVLIPLGRSLQRNAAAPEFFHFPRVVAAVDTEPLPGGDTSMLLKDRLYVGYGEKSAILEVISYNETAGRFEFQVVNDYRPGGKPQVAYADRAVCMSCHQNAAPIFSRQTWDETNANPRIARLLGNLGNDFHGVPIARGVDIPFAIDQATLRANEFAVTQLLWREGCGGGTEGARCRAYAFALALQYRLSGERGFDVSAAGADEAFHNVLQKHWRERWPGGLYLSDPTLANRDPLDTFNDAPASITLNPQLDAKGKKTLHDVLTNTDVRAPFEPLEPRAPLSTWRGDEPGIAARLVRGVGDFFAQADLRQIDKVLWERALRSQIRAQEIASICTYLAKNVNTEEVRVGFVCRLPEQPGAAGFAMQGRVYVRARRVLRVEVDSLTLNGVELRTLNLASNGVLDINGEAWSLTLPLEQNGMHVRSTNGVTLETMILNGHGAWGTRGPLAGTGVLAVRDDFAALWTALNAVTANAALDAFSDRPFRRAAAMPAVLAQLGVAPGTWCCIDERGLPPAVDDRSLALKTPAQP